MYRNKIKLDEDVNVHDQYLQSMISLDKNTIGNKYDTNHNNMNHVQHVQVNDSVKEQNIQPNITESKTKNTAWLLSAISSSSSRSEKMEAAREIRRLVRSGSESYWDENCSQVKEQNLFFSIIIFKIEFISMLFTVLPVISSSISK